MKAKPKTKAQATGVSGSLAIVLVFLASQLSIEMPPEVAAAFATIFSFAGAKFMRE